MNPAFTDELVSLYQGDCLEVLRELPVDSIDALVTDPPAGIAFMGKEWDTPGEWRAPISEHGFTDGGNRLPTPTIGSSRNPMCRNCHKHKRGWKDHPGCACASPDFDHDRHREREAFVDFMGAVMGECLRVLKPGAHGLVWAIPRTSHWTATALEDAGFEIRDVITHHFGSGFPKSLDVSKAIDKRRQAEATVIATWLKDLGSREEVAAAAGVTPRQVDHWIGENTPCPQMPTEARFRAICQAFGTVPEWAESMYEKVGEWRGTITHARSGGEDFAKRPGSTATPRMVDDTAIATKEAAQWQGWGTALKPSSEHWILVRKPLAEPNVAANVLRYGTGAINIDASRIEGTPWEPHDAGLAKTKFFTDGETPVIHKEPHGGGRWPANLILSHSPDCKQVGTRTIETGATIHSRPKEYKATSYQVGDASSEPGYGNGDGTEEMAAWECVEGCPVAELDRQSGTLKSGMMAAGQQRIASRGLGGYGDDFPDEASATGTYGDTGGASRFFATLNGREGEPSAERRYADEAGDFAMKPGARREAVSPSRFFYTAKADRSERNAGLEGLEEKPMLWSSGTKNPGSFQAEGTRKQARNFHPTVKPIDLMRYLCRMITPPGGVVLDCFAGSGSTGVAAKLEGFHCILIEKEADYVEITKRRLGWAVHEPELFSGV